MKPFRMTVVFILISLLLVPAGVFADQTPEPTAEPEPSPTPLFGSSLGYDDAQREAREKAQQTIQRRARAEGFYTADASDISYSYFSRRPHVQFAPGSTTKIMTALLVIENVPLDDVAVTPYEATHLGKTNTVLGLSTGEEMRVEDLLYGLMLVSGNDCAITLAFHLDGSEEAFAERMNARAAGLGMTNTNFTNPSGRNIGSNVSTPYDLALLTQEALKNEEFRKIVATATYTIPTNEMRAKPKEITNSNALVSDPPGKGCYYADAIGVKTGATVLGNCLVAAAQREDVTLICVQLGMHDEDNGEKRRELFRRSAQMFDYIFEYEYTHVDAEMLLSGYTDAVSVEGAAPDNNMLTVRADTTDAAAFRPIREIDLLASGSASFSVTSEVCAAAPVKEGEQVGTATFSYNERDWFTLPLIAAHDVELPPTPAPTEAPTPVPTPAPTEAPTAVPETPMPAPEPTDPPAPAEPEAPRRIGALWIVLPAAAVLGAAAAWLIIRKKKK